MRSIAYGQSFSLLKSHLVGIVSRIVNNPRNFFVGDSFRFAIWMTILILASEPESEPFQRNDQRLI